jgi:hypothetical protein
MNRFKRFASEFKITRNLSGNPSGKIKKRGINLDSVPISESNLTMVDTEVEDLHIIPGDLELVFLAFAQQTSQQSKVNSYKSKGRVFVVRKTAVMDDKPLSSIIPTGKSLNGMWRMCMSSVTNCYDSRILQLDHLIVIAL